MTTTPNPHAIDLTKGTDVPESTRLLFNDPHVPSFETMRTVVSETSNVLVGGGKQEGVCEGVCRSS